MFSTHIGKTIVWSQNALLVEECVESKKGLLLSLRVKKLLKSVNIWQSYK